MKIIIEIEASPEEADAMAAELVHYAIHEEGREIVSYWVENDE